MNEYKRKKVRRSSKKSNARKKNINENIFFDDENTGELPEKKKIKTKKAKKERPEKQKRIKEEIIENAPPENEADTGDFSDADGSAYKRRRFNVIKRTEKKGARKAFITVCALILIIAAVWLINFLLPTGIAESVSNFVSGMGDGSYPIEYNGSLTADSVRMGSANILLNDSSVTVFNNRGKQMFKHPHGFSNPVIRVSPARALVFDQGGKTAYIYNLSGLVDTVTTDSEITNACIGRNGSYAISCAGTEYTSTVTVYSKRGKKLYTWNSAKDIVNTLALSPTGKKLAVSCLNVSNGLAVSKLYVLEYSSADPVFSKDLGNCIVLALRTNTWGFAAVTEDGYNYFSWYGFKEKDYSVKDKKLAMYRVSGNETLLVFNRENDKSDNRIVLLSGFAGNKGKFDYNGVITDVQFKNGRIYVISDTKISVFNTKGEKLGTATCDWGVKRFYIISSDRLALITDDSIRETTIK